VRAEGDRIRHADLDRFLTYHARYRPAGGTRADEQVEEGYAGRDGVSADHEIGQAPVAPERLAGEGHGLARVRDQLDDGGEATVNAAKDHAAGAIAALTGGGAHISVDALRIATTCRNSILCLRKRGLHLQIGLTTQAENGMVALPVTGSFGMQAPHFTAMLAMVEARKLDPGKLISRTVGLEDVTGVVESMGLYGTSGVTVIARY
jgi:hypothetical protein